MPIVVEAFGDVRVSLQVHIQQECFQISPYCCEGVVLGPCNARISFRNNYCLVAIILTSPRFW